MHLWLALVMQMHICIYVPVFINNMNFIRNISLPCIEVSSFITVCSPMDFFLSYLRGKTPKVHGVINYDITLFAK